MANTAQQLRARLVAGAMAALAAGLVAPTVAAEGAPHLPSATLQPVFDRYVKPTGVDYARLKADASARQALSRFTAAAAQMPMSAPLSDWLNLYNALVVQQILQRYPLKSVMDVPGFFKQLTHPVAGQARTLDDIEHRIIRTRFKDARVHAALNCGAASCPRLSPRLFTPQDVDTRLDQLARAWVADEAQVRVRGPGLEVSAIFFWFSEDFERDAGGVRAWIERHASGAKRKRIAGLAPGAALAKRPYDWSLNASH